MLEGKECDEDGLGGVGAEGLREHREFPIESVEDDATLLHQHQS